MNQYNCGILFIVAGLCLLGWANDWTVCYRITGGILIGTGIPMILDYTRS
jgi:hypothetical protein